MSVLGKIDRATRERIEREVETCYRQRRDQLRRGTTAPPNEQLREAFERVGHSAEGLAAAYSAVQGHFTPAELVLASADEEDQP